MTTKNKKQLHTKNKKQLPTKKRKNPPDLTARNLTALKRRLDDLNSSTSYLLESMVPNLIERLADLERNRDWLADRLLAAVEKHVTAQAEDRVELAARLEVLEQARGRLEERVHALGPVGDQGHARDWTAGRVFTLEPAPTVPQDFTPPTSKAARRKGTNNQFVRTTPEDNDQK